MFVLFVFVYRLARDEQGGFFYASITEIYVLTNAAHSIQNLHFLYLYINIPAAMKATKGIYHISDKHTHRTAEIPHIAVAA